MFDPRTVCPEWDDDLRMTALFSPLQSKELNPEAWNSKIEYWTTVIEKISEELGSCMLTVESLKGLLQRKGKSPHCLEAVIQEAVVENRLALPNVYLDSVDIRQTWGSWFFSVGTGLVKSIGHKVIGTSSKIASVVVPQQVQYLSDRLLTEIRNMEGFLNFNKSLFITEEVLNKALQTIEDQPSADFILDVLVKKRLVSSLTVQGKLFYQVATENSATAFGDVDTGLVAVRLTLDNIKREVEKVEALISKEGDHVKQNLKEGKRAKAKMALRRQKVLKEKLEKLMNQEMNLENIYEEILNADNNKLIAQAYKSGLSALSSMVDSSQVESAEKTMSELADLIGLNREITESLSSPGDQDVDDASLEDELNSMLQVPEKADPVKPTPGQLDEEELVRMLDNLDTVDTLEPVIGRETTDKVQKSQCLAE